MFNYKKVLLVVLSCLMVVFLQNFKIVYAVECEENYTEEYKWYLGLSEKEKHDLEYIPRKYTYTIEDYNDENSIKNSEEVNITSLYKSTYDQNYKESYDDLTASYCSLSFEDSLEKLYYSMYGQGDLNIQVENQGELGLCWIFAPIKTIEIAIEKKSGLLYDFSERYIDFYTSKVMNGDSYWRGLGGGASFSTFQEYLNNHNNRGLVQESNFEGNDYMLYTGKDANGEYYCTNTQKLQQKITSTEVEDITITKMYNFPQITKDENNQIDENELSVRNDIKRFIRDNGAVCASVDMDLENYYNENNDSLFSDGGNGTSMPNAHCITIIGWDDTYPKENFTLYETYKAYGIDPDTKMQDGAWICLNSWGTDLGRNGYFFVSYNDYFIERDVMGVRLEDIKLDSDYEKIEFSNQSFYNYAVNLLGNNVVKKDDENLIIKVEKDESITLQNPVLEIGLLLKDSDLPELKQLLKLFSNLQQVNLSTPMFDTLEDLGDLSGLENIKFVNKRAITFSIDNIYQVVKENMGDKIISDNGNNKIEVDYFTFFNKLSLINGNFTNSDLGKISYSLMSYNVDELDLSNNCIDNPKSILTGNYDKVLLNNQKLVISENRNNIVNLPEIFKLATDENSSLYSESGFTFNNCKISDNNSVVINNMNSNASIVINEGNAKGTILNIINNVDETENSVSQENNTDQNNSVEEEYDQEQNDSEEKDSDENIPSQNNSEKEEHNNNTQNDFEEEGSEEDSLSEEDIIKEDDKQLEDNIIQNEKNNVNNNISININGTDYAWVQVVYEEEGINKVYTSWSSSNEVEPKNEEMNLVEVENGTIKVEISNLNNGSYYLWISSVDNSGNVIYKCSQNSLKVESATEQKEIPNLTQTVYSIENPSECDQQDKISENTEYVSKVSNESKSSDNIIESKESNIEINDNKTTTSNKILPNTGTNEILHIILIIFIVGIGLIGMIQLKKIMKIDKIIK